MVLEESADVPERLLEADPPPVDLTPPSPPESGSESDASVTSDSDEDDVDDADDVAAELAGYEFCSREAIRYLLEEEHLDRNHPVIRQLQQCLSLQRFQLVLNSGSPSIPDSAN